MLAPNYHATENLVQEYPLPQQLVPPYLQRACPSLVGYLLVRVGHNLELQHISQHQLCRASPSAAGMRIEQLVVCLVHLNV